MKMKLTETQNQLINDIVNDAGKHAGRVALGLVLITQLSLVPEKKQSEFLIRSKAEIDALLKEMKSKCLR